MTKIPNLYYQAKLIKREKPPIHYLHNEQYQFKLFFLERAYSTKEKMMMLWSLDDNRTYESIEIIHNKPSKFETLLRFLRINI
jgi:hypothetical protein